MLQIDLAENYTNAYQDEIQAAHWTSRQVTLFNAVEWSKAEVQSYAIVSDALAKVVDDLMEKKIKIKYKHGKVAHLQ